MRTLGIDPGLTGALCLLDIPLSGRPVATLTIEDMPTAEQMIGKVNKSIIMEAMVVALVKRLCPDHVYLEQVHSMPKQGVVSTFTFGMGYGVVRGVLAGLGLPVTHVPPQVWGKLVGLPRGEGGSRLRAAQLFPAYADQFARKMDHGRADAALIALAGHRAGNPF